MPLAAALPAIGGLVGGALSGVGNRRPPSLDPTQSSSLDSLLKLLMPQVGATPKIDPTQQSLMFDEIARSGVGGANRVKNIFASRGLSGSGLEGRALTENSNAITSAQTGTNLSLQQQAVNQRNTTIQQILGLLGVSNIPGQSGFGGAMAGIAPFLGPLLSGLFGKKSSGGGEFPGTPGTFDYGQPG